jgi:uncharacterized NAD-dependent epimerase/dehydratase family protein
MAATNRRFVILTEGYCNPTRAKTASCVIRYCPDEVLALLDTAAAGRTSRDLLNVGDVPIVGRLSEVPEARTLLVGVANPGGIIPDTWRTVIVEALERGMDVVCGMHEFLADDPKLASLARANGAKIIDVRNHRLQRIARGEELREECLRIQTVGHDCSVGKMVTSVEIVNGLKARGCDAKFAATGQTGIIVEGDGYPIDCMVADFISGAAEQLVLDHQHHEVLVVEGQGSLVHPSYSGVTLGLLHGCQPHALILCYEPGRPAALGLDHVPLPPLATIKSMFETMASLRTPCSVIGIAMNSRQMTADAAEAERERVRAEFDLPVCDVIRHGADALVEAVLQLRQSHSGWPRKSLSL